MRLFCFKFGFSHREFAALDSPKICTKISSIIREDKKC